MLQPTVPAWRVISVATIDRAQRFQEALPDVSMKRQRYMSGMVQAVFARGGRGHASGALVQSDPTRAPSQSNRSRVYPDVRGIHALLTRMDAFGGEALSPLMPNDTPFPVGHIRHSDGVGLASVERAP